MAIHTGEHMKSTDGLLLLFKSGSHKLISPQILLSLEFPRPPRVSGAPWGAHLANTRPVILNGGPPEDLWQNITNKANLQGNVTVDTFVHLLYN